MGEFVTVSKGDPEFLPLLLGTFSEKKLAMPVKTLNVKSQQEQVTFKIVDKAQTTLLTALSSWYSWSRNIYLVFPIVGVLALLFNIYGSLQWDLVIFAFLSLECFLMSLILYSDYHDYLNGIDRINEHNAQKILLKGFIRPFQALKLAKCFLGGSFFLALYLFAHRPMASVFAIVAFGLTFIFSSSVFEQKLKGFTSFMIFILSGPLLALGMEFLLFGQCSLLTAVVGWMFGVHSFKFDFVKQMRDIFYNSKAKIVTLSTTIGFDKSKAIYLAVSAFHLVVLFSFAYLWGKPSMGVLIVIALGFEFYINRLLFKASSFLSSNMTQCLGLQKLHFAIENFVMVFLFLAPLWLVGGS